jgi:transketolase
LTRQDLPVVTPADGSTSRGAYVLAEAEGGKPEVVLIATGSEVSIALKAREILAGEGIRARVVSMPSWELFDAQTKAYRKRVLPGRVPRLSVEAGATLAWGHYLGPDGKAAIGLDRFGASAPYKVIYEQLGLTAERVAEVARGMVKPAIRQVKQ